MKKFFYFICVCLFTLKSADICTDFVSFYEKYFNQILKYEKFSKAEKRFAFIFYYFESRNIADLRLEKNNFIDRVKNKGLSEAEIKEIKDFFIATTDQLSFFDQYKAKSIGWSDPKLNTNDLIYKSFDTVRSDLAELPNIADMHETMADMTFFVKSDYDHETIFQNSFSDAHSSPEYFGKGFKKIDRNSNENKDQSLEAQYQAYSRSMNIAVSFFGGDLDDRDMLNFLDLEITYDQKKMSYDSEGYYQRTNFLRYNFFKDFHHTVYAAWQLYCLYHDQPKLITRWQVFGNHETLTINRDQDKKNTCSSFVFMMSQIRQYILPTEIDFINEDKKEIISLSHAFGARRGLVETHENKLLHDNFRVMYLKSKPEYREENLTIQGAYGNHVGFVKAFTKQSFQKNSELFENFQQQGTYQSMNPQLWTDYTPGFNDLDLSNDDTEFSYSTNEGRGYRVEGNINEVLEWRKKIVLHNLECFGLVGRDDFAYFHVSGHTHGGNDTTKLVFESQKDILSFSNLRHFAKDGAWLFTACSCHNKYGIELAYFISKKNVFLIAPSQNIQLVSLRRLRTMKNFLQMLNRILKTDFRLCSLII
jgi:hypothetical protein